MLYATVKIPKTLKIDARERTEGLKRSPILDSQRHGFQTVFSYGKGTKRRKGPKHSRDNT